MRGSVKGRKKKKNIENERRDKSCWHNVSTIRFAGRRTAFYFCFAPIIDEPCRCFCLTNGRCLCDLALFALHPFTSLRIALRSQCLFSSLSLFLSPSPLYIFFVFLVIFTTDALIKETSKPKPFTPGNALSFLFRPPLRQPISPFLFSHRRLVLFAFNFRWEADRLRFNYSTLPSPTLRDRIAWANRNSRPITRGYMLDVDLYASPSCSLRRTRKVVTRSLPFSFESPFSPVIHNRVI